MTVERPAPAHLRPGRRVVKLHRHHGSFLDACHLLDLHGPTPIDRLVAWPPTGAPWTPLYLRVHRTVAVLVLVTAVLVALLANG